MYGKPDILIRDAHGTPVAALDAKAMKPDHREAAHHYRLATESNAQLRQLRFYLIATFDVLYVWDLAHEPLEAEGPHLDLALPNYLRKLLPPLAYDPSTLELAAFQWLLKLRSLGIDAVDQSEVVLQQIGFVEAIQAATIAFEEAA